MTETMPKITALSGAAKRQGLKRGDDIVSIGGFPMLDELDYLYYDNESSFELELIRDGKPRKIKIKKPAAQSLELEFDCEMKPFRCKNKCIFCFVDQLPKGLRDTLYIKDDDYRYSFISGSYVTLTNVSDEEVNRIIRLGLSPLYISVHAFDDDIRFKMLKNPNTRKLKEYMSRLGSNGIKMHTQLVVVPGINDGAVLEESIRGLHGIKGVETVAVVPVGMTAHREKLDKLKAVDSQNAAETVKLVEKLHCELNGFCWCADEYYLKAGLPVPDYSYYGAFEQIENGVGLLADFDDNLDYALSQITPCVLANKIAFATGVSFAPLLTRKLRPVSEKLGITAEVFGIENDFFGRSVTVAGLVTATDILARLKGISADALVIPDNMLREFSDRFLDDVSVGELERALGVPIITVAHNGSDLPNRIIEFFTRKKER